eukprot:CAMPEP_0197393410 /NCGR_PEP_ID=MMETSP1165-20131217/4302_1 /TAXON_ID=284809 /ORGANISM="Chrysocystis fragilis, Strain CCMP3189" /LENGTH=84 /DNA_ID=CAMNT_0042919073 /DNA_START=91 /DNA_END=345 /DNA_ORIENTATION=+
MTTVTSSKLTRSDPVASPAAHTQSPPSIAPPPMVAASLSPPSDDSTVLGDLITDTVDEPDAADVHDAITVPAIVTTRSLACWIH